jgi:alpha-L-fucosidase
VTRQRRGTVGTLLNVLRMERPRVLQPGDLGLIFHWGVYSVPAYDDTVTARKREILNGSEWYAHRLYSTFRVGPASRKTRECHLAAYGGAEYQDLAAHLTAEHWRPEEWVQLARRVGARYLIITARHHDGYCMWPTTTCPGWNSADTGPKRDVVGELASACRKEGLLFGVYYSLLEWDWLGKPNSTTRAKGITTPTSKKRIERVHLQVGELLTRYRPDVWWFDGDWGSARWRTGELVRSIRLLTPHAEINDRLGADSRHLSTFRSSPDRWIPEERPGTPWESIQTVGLSWGRNLEQSGRDYKTGEELATLYERVSGMGGRLLLNLGPDRTGRLDEAEVQALLDMAKVRSRRP